ncbi:MAG: hypothetical protein ICV68_13165 [Pyrinomonadaceae bacterium]|nr:hypothetical protein [Pyrinomonadaceae bacterium]
MPRTKKRISLFLAFSLALLAFDVARETPAFAATTVTTNETIPYNQTVFDCNGNPVLLSGSMHVLSHYTTGLPNGGSRFSMHTNFQNVSGTGQVDPIEYQGVSSNHFTSNDNNPTTVFTSIQTFRLISQGSTDNLNVQIVMHMTVNANGETTSTVVNVNVECNG